jgi:hypothetical protein
MIIPLPEICYKCKHKFELDEIVSQDFIFSCKCFEPKIYLSIDLENNDDIDLVCLKFEKYSIYFLLRIEKINYNECEDFELYECYDEDHLDFWFQPNILDYDETISTLNRYLKLKEFQ